MERNEVSKQVYAIFCDVLDKNDLVLNDQSTANEVDEWDSLAHIHLVVSIEKTFDIHFSSKEIQSWENVGEMIDCIYNKVK